MAPISLVILRVFIAGKIINTFEMDSVVSAGESSEMTRAGSASLHQASDRPNVEFDLQRPTPNLLLNLIKTNLYTPGIISQAKNLPRTPDAHYRRCMIEYSARNEPAEFCTPRQTPRRCATLSREIEPQEMLLQNVRKPQKTQGNHSP
jgi:hypothetical protein